MASTKQNLLRPLLTGYSPLKGTYDEYFKDQNSPRPGLKGLTRLLDDLGEHEFRLRQQLADLQAGDTPSNLLALDALSGMEQRHLKDALGNIRQMQEGIGATFQTGMMR